MMSLVKVWGNAPPRTLSMHREHQRDRLQNQSDGVDENDNNHIL